MATFSFYSFDDKFLDEIIHVQSIKALSIQDNLPANVLKCWKNVFGPFFTVPFIAAVLISHLVLISTVNPG